MTETIKYLLGDDRIPRAWYNIIADLPEPPAPVLHPASKAPIGAADMAPLFPPSLIAQENATEREIEIPRAVREVYALWRPTPLYRARSLERVLDTPARIYYKYEGISPTGSHKPNTAVPQAFFNKQDGTRRLATETGAGQWGTSLAFACSLFGIDVDVYMVKVSFEQKPYRRAAMEAYGARCVASPSTETASGREILARDSNATGSLGIAISEAVERAAARSDTKYALGSVLNHVMLHQTVIGIEASLQMDMAGDEPDIVIACTGGGSNFAGLVFPLLRRKLTGESGMRIIATEPAACPTLTRGVFAYDFGDSAHLTPLMKMRTLGSQFMPAGIHAGGLRYHGMSPLVSHLLELGLIEPRAFLQTQCFAAGVLFAKAEGIIPAPEANHAVKAAIDEALLCKRDGVARTILFNLSGHGHFDMQSYADYFAGKLTDQGFAPEDLSGSLQELPSIAAA